MTKQVLTQAVQDLKIVRARRTRKLAQFFRAVALFSAPLRSAKAGMRRRK